MRKEKIKRNAGIQTKFLLGLAAILVFFSGLASMTIYLYQKETIEDDAYQKSVLIMTAMSATRGYVRDVLRPKMYDIIDRDDFVLEAMSSSYISRTIMERVNKELDDFTYRRVSLNARNPDYEATEIEREMIQYFNENPHVDEWQNIIEDETRNRVFMRFQPVVFTQSCLHCHGEPSDAPDKIIENYGSTGGFYRNAGDVAGVISVSLPVGLSLLKIKELAIAVFLGVIPSIILLYAIISVFFNRLIAQNLRFLLNMFRTNLRDDQGLALIEKSQSLDEIEELTEAAETIAEHLQKNNQTLEKNAAEILSSKELLQSVFDGITDPLVLLDKEHKTIKIVNKAFLNHYNMTLTDVLKRDITRLDFSSSCPIAMSADIISTITDQPISKDVQLEDGGIYRIYYYPVRDESRDIESIVCYVKDITEQKEMELQIQHTEKLVSMGQLAAGVAHEINNPLGVILCHIDLIKDDPQLSSESLADLNIIEKHVGNCRNIISDLLRFARQTKPSLNRASINDVISEVVSMVTNQMGIQSIRIETNFEEGIPAVSIDIDRIKQVILNLLINSSQAIGEQGVIRIYTSYVVENRQARIVIEDNGNGIPENLRDKIFDPFYTTKAPGKGTGLGLSVSFGIIQEHGGDIVVEDGPSKTTCFRINLPVEEPDND